MSSDVSFAAISLGSLALMAVTYLACAMVRRHFRNHQGADPNAKAKLEAWKRQLWIFNYTWTAVFFLGLLVTTIDWANLQPEFPGTGPGSRPGEPALVGIFLLAGFLILVKNGCGYWMTLIARRNFPEAPGLHPEQTPNFFKKAKEYRAFDRWVAEMGAEADPQIGRIHRAEKAVTKILYVVVAIFAILGLCVFVPR